MKLESYKFLVECADGTAKYVRLTTESAKELFGEIQHLEQKLKQKEERIKDALKIIEGWNECPVQYYDNKFIKLEKLLDQ